MNENLHILLLEDSREDAELNEHILRKAGIEFESLRVEERESFITALLEFHPDLILADFHLPHFNGLEALAIVRERHPHLPVIFVTGTMGEEAAVESLHNGASDYILKDRLGRLPDAVMRALSVAEADWQLFLTEQQLATSETRFRALVETSSDWIWEVDAQGRYTYVSPASMRLLGYAPEEMLGRTPFDFMPPEEAARIRQKIQQYQMEKQPLVQLENTCLHRDGHPVIIETSGVACYSSANEFVGYRGIDRDITERKQAEQALLRSEQRYHNAVDSLRDAFIVIESTEGRVLQWNPAAEKIFGYSRDEMLGRNLHETLTPARFREAHRQAFPAFGHTGQGAAINRTLELTALHKDGHEFPIELSLSSIQEEGHWQAVGIIRDISERKRDQERLANQARLAEALLELPRAAEELDETGFMQRGQELAEELTGSEIAFIHFVNDDQETIELVAWSRRTLEHYCHAAYDKHYPVSQAGIWADALRQRKAVMVNDYASADGKHGLPEGHAHLERLISVPVIENGLVRMMAGVGNKAIPYVEADVETVQLISNEIWRIVRQRRADQALRESETKFRSLYDSMTEGMALHKMVYDESGKAIDYQLIDVNPAYETILGLKRDQVIGLKASQVYGTGTAPFLDIYAGVVRTKRPVRFEGSLETMEKTFGISAISPLPEHFATLFSDVTDRMKTEALLRKLAQAVEQSPESIVITDLEANLEYVNETFVRNSGFSREEAIGKNPRILHSGKTPKSTYDSLWNAMRLGLPWQGEFINKRKDGSEYVEFAIITPLRQPDGRVTHYVAVKEDITEKKRIALELDQHRLHLEELVESRTLELSTARQEAERLARVKSEFLANMSHEIRTPLNAVLGFAQIGQRDGLNPHDRDTFGRILDSGQLLLRVVNDILDFSKIEAGKLEIETGRLHPGRVLDRCAGLVHDSAQNKGLAFRVEESDDLPASCQGDELRVTQVLMNLLTNAIKFTQHGTVTLSAGIQKEDAGDWLILRVSDSGIGISQAEQARLFMPFEQADSSTTRRFGGTGLGLAISKRLLDLMGGRIQVASQPGAGSVFKVMLPLLNAEGLASARARDMDANVLAPTGQHLQDLAILVAEDNEVNRLVLAELLSKEGCKLTQVENGRLAVELIRNRGVDAFDLVLMDIQMPVLDGIAATREIKAFAPDLPIIGLTAHALAEERENCLAAGMVDHVAKPIVLRDLLNAIRAHIRGLPEVMPEREASTSAEAELVDAAGIFIDWNAIELQYRDKQEFLDHLLHTIVKSNQDKPYAIQSAIEAHDYKQLAFITHSLKGMAGDILPRQVRDLAVLTEAESRNELDDAFSHAAELAAGMLRFLDEINAYIKRNSSRNDATSTADAGDQQTIDDAEINEILERLKELLIRSDTSVNELESRSAAMLRRMFGAEAERLSSEIQSFDYEAALVRLRHLRQLKSPEPDIDKDQAKLRQSV